jgi:hypothetical protein
MASPLAELFSDLKAVFAATSSPWYLFGAQAAIIHGASRMTADVDVTVMLGDCPLTSLVEALTNGKFELRASNVTEFAAQTRIVPVVHVKSGILVDIVLGGSRLEEQFELRARQHDIDNIKVPVASSEDLITMKILSGREKDLDDALAIITAQIEKLDIQHIQTTLGTLEDILDRSDLLTTLEYLIQRAHG